MSSTCRRNATSGCGGSSTTTIVLQRQRPGSAPRFAMKSDCSLTRLRASHSGGGRGTHAPPSPAPPRSLIPVRLLLPPHLGRRLAFVSMGTAPTSSSLTSFMAGGGRRRRRRVSTVLDVHRILTARQFLAFVCFRRTPGARAAQDPAHTVCPRFSEDPGYFWGGARQDVIAGRGGRQMRPPNTRAS
jgi:hypothetical protein